MQDSTYQDWITPSHALVMPQACDRCRLTACHSIHDDATPNCPPEFCEVCTDLTESDQQIAAVHDQLINLVRKRWAIKSRFNDHHDQLTRRLPTEIVSDIFLLIAETMPSPPFSGMWSSGCANCPPLFLGAICKRWRSITLGLPQIWCKIDIKPGSPRTSFRSTDEWLRRSSTTPLSLTYRCGLTWGARVPRPAPRRIVNLLRSHATRWKHIAFSGSWKAFRDLINNIDDILSVRTLDITIFDGDTTALEPIQVQEPLCPKELKTCHSVSIRSLPLQWNNLTHLDASWMHLDELLHVIRHGLKLRSCILRDLMESYDPEGIRYALPSTPIMNQSMTLLKLGSFPFSEHSNLIRHLTLPSLTTFNYYIQHANSSGLDTLEEFLNRSRAPLDTFVLDITLSAAPMQYERLSAITRIDLRIHGHDEMLNVTEDFFRALARSTGPLILPRLRELRVFAPFIRSSSWSIFCDILRTTERENTAPQIVAGCAEYNEVTESLSDQHPAGVWETRPLNSVYIRLSSGAKWSPIAEEDVFAKLMDIRASGVRLEIVDEHGFDLIECAAKIILSRELPFSRGEHRHELTWDEWASDSESSH